MRRGIRNHRNDSVLDNGVVFDGRVGDHDDDGIGSDDLGIKEKLISRSVILFKSLICFFTVYFCLFAQFPKITLTGHESAVK